MLAPLLFMSCTVTTQPTATQGGQQTVAGPSKIKEYSIGHSLSSDIPDMVGSLAASAGFKHEFQEQFRLGASLDMQWNEPKKGPGQWDDKQYRILYPNSLGKGGYDAVVLIDSVPRGGPEQEKNSIDYLTKFVEYIDQTNPKAKIYYCEAWHSLKSGTGKADWDTVSPTRHLTWRKRVDVDAFMWERIRHAAVKSTGKKIVLIPQAQAVAALGDAIESGKVPGFKKTDDLFADDIHLKPYGMYLIACLQYGVLYQRSPVGMTADLKDRWGRPYWNRPFYDGKTYPPMDPGAVAEIQKIAAKYASVANSE